MRTKLPRHSSAIVPFAAQSKWEQGATSGRYAIPLTRVSSVLPLRA